MTNTGVSNPQAWKFFAGMQGAVGVSVRLLVVAVLILPTSLTLHTSVAAAQEISPALGGSGTTNYIPIWTNSTTLGNSKIYQLGSDVGIGTTSPLYPLEVHGASVAIKGMGTSKYGVLGDSDTGRGVEGDSNTKGGVVGTSVSGNGVTGVACSGCGAAAVAGIGKHAGTFVGDVAIQGTLLVSGVKLFRIDHPLDPANKYLNHAAVESSEVLDVYSGNITTDLSGSAIVVLPSYFSALNRDCRYQLTVVGQFAQAIVLREIEDNTFVIKTDRPLVKVSWQVTGVRQDASLKNHPMQVEEDKPEQERGYYLDPQSFGQPEERSLVWLYQSDIMQDAKALWSREKANHD